MPYNPHLLPSCLSVQSYSMPPVFDHMCPVCLCSYWTVQESPNFCWTMVNYKQLSIFVDMHCWYLLSQERGRYPRLGDDYQLGKPSDSASPTPEDQFRTPACFNISSQLSICLSTDQKSWCLGIMDLQWLTSGGKVHTCI